MIELREVTIQETKSEFLVELTPQVDTNLIRTKSQ